MESVSLKFALVGVCLAAGVLAMAGLLWYRLRRRSLSGPPKSQPPRDAP